MTIIDISRTLTADIAVWPGDTPFSLEQMMAIGQGEVVNLTTLRMSAHSGSHVDAPLHFIQDDIPIDQLELLPFWGKAQVVNVQSSAGGLTPEDFAQCDLTRAPRLLVRSKASTMDPGIFPSEYVYPTPALADFLGQQGIILYGCDTPSMDPETSKTLDGHHALRRNQIAILEWLALEAVSEGLYELVALPLKIAGGDGSPVRAVLKILD